MEGGAPWRAPGRAKQDATAASAEQASRWLIAWATPIASQRPQFQGGCRSSLVSRVGSRPPKLVQCRLADDVGHFPPRRDLVQRSPAAFQFRLDLFPGIQRQPVSCDVYEWQNDSWIQAFEHAHGCALPPGQGG